MIIQSYIDLITNSSTTVYQFANNIDSVKEIINSILKITGTSYTCDDLFDIKISYDVTLWDVEDYYVSKAQRLEDPVVKELLNKYINSNYVNFEYLENLYNYLVTNCGEMDLNTLAESENTNYSSYSELKQALLIVINKRDLQYLKGKIKILEICE